MHLVDGGLIGATPDLMEEVGVEVTEGEGGVVVMVVEEEEGRDELTEDFIEIDCDGDLGSEGGRWRGREGMREGSDGDGGGRRVRGGRREQRRSGRG
jgi:hypothetical protein